MPSSKLWLAASLILAVAAIVVPFALPAYIWAGGLVTLLAVCCLFASFLLNRRESGKAAAAEEDAHSGLAGIAANMPGAIIRCLADEERTLHSVGGDVERLLGITADQLFERKYYRSAILPDDRARVDSVVTAALRDEHSYDVEYRMIHADGSVIWVQERGCPVFGAERTYVDAMVFDIMSRKLSEREREDLHWHREAMDALEHALSCGGNLDDAAGRALEVVRQSLGTDRAWFMKAESEKLDKWHVVFERTAMDYPGLLNVGGEYVVTSAEKAFLDAVLRSHKPVATEPGSEVGVPVTLKAGFSVRSILSMALRADDGSQWLFGVHQCSSDRIWTAREKQLFQAMAERLQNALNQGLTKRDLLESQERFRIYTDQALLGICVLRNGRFEYVNMAMADIFGYSRSELLEFGPDDILSLIHADDRLMVAEQMEIKQHGKPGFKENYVFRGLRKDGGSCWIEIFSRTVHHGGEPADLAMMLDITEKRRLQEREVQEQLRLAAQVKDQNEALMGKTRELDEARTELLKLDQMKSSMLTTVSHDLRTPLTSIIGFSKLLRKDVANLLSGGEVCDSSSTAAKRLERKLGIVEEEGEHLTKLVNDFLDLTQLESGEMQWRDVDVNLGEALEGAVRAGERLFHDTEEVDFVWEVPGTLPDMHLDPVRLEQAVVNLLKNAEKFTEKGTVSLVVEAEDAEVRILVNDTGRGIPEDELDRIFESFHRVEQGDTLRRTRRGSGLGLTISREIVVHYGGSLEVQSELGRGSTFTIVLPLSG